MIWLKKNWNNVLFGVLILLLLVPQTGKPIKIFVNRLIAFSPSAERIDDRERLEDYYWVLSDMDGNQVNFESFRGKKIILNYWATWCPPCIAEMPRLQDLYNDFGEDVVFLFVTNDEKDLIQKFDAKYGYDIPVFYPLSQAPELLQTNTLPTTYLIDEEGFIVIKKTGAADWNSQKVRALLSQH